MFPGRGNALPKSSNRRMQSNHDPSTLLASAGVVENGYESVRNYQQNNRSPNHNKENFDESSQFSPNKIKNLEKISSFSAAQKDAKSSRVVNKILTIRGEMKHKKLKCSASNSPILTPISATVSLEPLGKYLVSWLSRDTYVFLRCIIYRNTWDYTWDVHTLNISCPWSVVILHLMQV